MKGLGARAKCIVTSPYFVREMSIDMIDFRAVHAREGINWLKKKHVIIKLLIPDSKHVK